MAYGDHKSIKSSGGGGRVSYGRSETQAERDARARAASKAILDKVASQPNPCEYLLQSATDGYLADMFSVTHQITTRGRYDWERILDLLTPACKDKVFQALDQSRANRKERLDRQAQERKAEYEHLQMVWAEEAKAREQAEYEKKLEIVNASQLMLGSLQSETSQVFQRKERYELDNGDYLEDPVTSRLRSGGWMEETKRRGGFKLQLTLSLDVSNSNWHNRVADPAIRAFQELVLASRALQSEYPDDVIYSAWMFSMNRDGKGVKHLVDYDTRYVNGSLQNVDTDDPLKEVRKLFNLDYAPNWAGEDSWLSPLLQQIKIWEDRVGDGYTKLDIILSDGVFERKVDITAADTLQAQRGQVQTVILNFMNEDNWHSGRLPYQCVQYAVNSDNVNGILRQVLAYFMEAYI